MASNKETLENFNRVLSAETPVLYKRAENIKPINAITIRLDKYGMMKWILMSAGFEGSHYLLKYKKGQTKRLPRKTKKKLIKMYKDFKDGKLRPKNPYRPILRPQNILNPEEIVWNRNERGYGEEN